MADQNKKFIDRSGSQTPDKHTHGDHSLPMWEPHHIPKAEIAEEIKRLASLPKPNNGVRRTQVVHPRCEEERYYSFAPTVDIALDVLLPGERTKPVRQNSSTVNFCIQGSGEMIINGETFDFEPYDVITTPSMAVHEYINETDEMQVRLRYTNGSLLERLCIHYVDEDPPMHGSKDDDMTEAAGEGGEDVHAKFENFQLTDDGAWLMPYEKLVAPDAVEMKPHKWPWKKVKAELDKFLELGQDYEGRRLYLLYDPVTGRSNGTTPNFFATITMRQAGITDKPHRHTSAAMNYIFSGKGHSVVENKRYEWESGDLMFTAPGWAVHSHSADTGIVYELTIQDMPLNINMDSLMWQEDMEGPISMLGSHAGFLTNRDKLAAAE